VTDAPLIEPWLLSFTTGSTIDVHEGVNQYVKVTERFLQYQSTGTKKGILTKCVTHPQYNVKDEESHSGKDSSGSFQRYWEIHVAPCGLNGEGQS
jgi:platelet-activating factor acetylhydrolase